MIERGVSPGSMLQIDIRKAYDTINWEFLRASLFALGFPASLVGHVMAGVPIPMCFININGKPHRFFPTTRGLRQEDPFICLIFVWKS